MVRSFGRRRCVSLAAVQGDTQRGENRDTETMRRIKRKDSTQRGRPAVPDPADRTAGGGSEAQPPLHLIYMVKVGNLSSCLRS